MKLSHFRDVLAVVETGSLRAAGRHLGVAQPAITRSIKELERELGVTLFERHAKGIRLTEIGAKFVRRVEAFQNQLRLAQQEVEQLKGRWVGEVSVALSTATCMSLLPKALESFTKRHPDVVVKISESLFQPIENDLASGKFDFWVGPLDPSGVSSQFAVETLFENNRRVVARKGHPLSSASSLADLVDAHWVRPTLSTRNTEADFDGVFERADLPPPRVMIHARSSLITIMAVANTDLLTMLPQQWFNFEAVASLLQAFDLIEPISAAPMCLVRSQGLPLTPMAEQFSDLIRKAANNHVLERARERNALQRL
ncbi:LysR substrate-binding domain-containing protein [Sphingobium fluviale]|uniref:LysR family transcriptional regulator n=1 Tax=Sphingobium fluviale TaxID=2506423 RepID=A0A4Q1KHC7_9SPHN|nr:LysR substrate-binding domain-containing protein [Sphingobium fluviale]RXR28529.1 LysR family transcriptional regulator [Sphingobium fluviale]